MAGLITSNNLQSMLSNLSSMATGLDRKESQSNEAQITNRDIVIRRVYIGRDNKVHVSNSGFATNNFLGRMLYGTKKVGAEALQSALKDAVGERVALKATSHFLSWASVTSKGFKSSVKGALKEQDATNTANRQALIKDLSADHVDGAKIMQNMSNLFDQGYQYAARDESDIRDFSNMFKADLKDMSTGDLKKLNNALAENSFFEGMAQCNLPLSFYFDSPTDKNRKWSVNIQSGDKFQQAASKLSDMGRMVVSLRTSVFEALRSKGEDPVQVLDDKHFEHFTSVKGKDSAFVREGNMVLKSPEINGILEPAKAEFTPHQYSPGHILLASFACGGDVGKAMEKLGEFSEQVLSAQRSGAPTPSWTDQIGRMAQQTSPSSVIWA